MTLSDMNYDNSSTLCIQSGNKVVKYSYPRRILLLVSDIIQHRKYGSDKEATKEDLMLKEIAKVNAKVEVLTRLMNNFVDEASLDL